MNVVSRGIIFIVTGQKCAMEACGSAASVKQCMPEIPITIFSDVSPVSGLFDRIVQIDNLTYGPEDKISYISQSPYQETLYLDSDTMMVEEVREIFLLLRRFDLAAAHAPYRAQYHVPEVPDCFPEYNTGVVLFRQSKQTDWLFHRWQQIYREDRLKSLNWIFPGGADWYRRAIPNQPSFRRSLYESGLRIATLPPEYNCRFPFPGYVHTQVKIIHGRAHSLARISEELNKTLLPRVHVMRWGRLKILESAMPPGDHFLTRIRWSLNHQGILPTIRTTLKQVVAKLRNLFC